jgi:hypothetical protein
MISYFNDLPLGQLQIRSNSSIGTVSGVTGVSVAHKSIGTLVRSTITLTNVAQTVVNGTEYQSTLLWTMPAGQVQFRAASANLTQTTTSALATTLNASSTGAVGVGTTVAVATTLATTTQNIIPTTAFVSSATVNVAGTAVTPILGTGVVGDFFVVDGTSDSIDVYLNSAFATTLDVDGDATMTWSGTIVIDWDLLSFSFGAI